MLKTKHLSLYMYKVIEREVSQNLLVLSKILSVLFLSPPVHYLFFYSSARAGLPVCTCSCMHMHTLPHPTHIFCHRNPIASRFKPSISSALSFFLVCLFNADAISSMQCLQSQHALLMFHPFLFSYSSPLY